jgi:hypothetical protein
MEGVGFRASEQDSLPLLFREVYGFELRNCGDCKTKAYDSLIKWANKKETKPNNYMDFKIKKEFEKNNFTFRHAGKILVVNAANLNDERARMMLASKYAHAIEGQPDMFSAASFTGSLDGIVESPNESEVSTASTSTEVKSGGVELIVSKGGKLAKSDGSEPKKRGRPFGTKK